MPMHLSAQREQRSHLAAQPLPALEGKTHILRFPKQNLHLPEPPASFERREEPRRLFPAFFNPFACMLPARTPSSARRWCQRCSSNPVAADTCDRKGKNR
jgi:hypothetical protein